MNATLFIHSAGPTLLLVAATTLFAGLSARKRKDVAVGLLFAGLLLEFLALLAADLGRAVASNSEISHVPVNMSFVKVMLGIGHYVAFVSGAVFLVGWIIFLAEEQKRLTDSCLVVIQA